MLFGWRPAAFLLWRRIAGAIQDCRRSVSKPRRDTRQIPAPHVAADARPVLRRARRDPRRRRPARQRRNRRPTPTLRHEADLVARRRHRIDGGFPRPVAHLSRSRRVHESGMAHLREVGCALLVAAGVAAVPVANAASWRDAGRILTREGTDRTFVTDFGTDRTGALTVLYRGRDFNGLWGPH